MTFEEALAIVTAALAPRSLSELQINVFRGAWNKQSYFRIALELNHKDGYIKDVGAELWQLLTQALGIQVTKLNLQDALTQYVQQRQMRDLPALPQRNRVDWGEAPDVSHFCGRQAKLTQQLVDTKQFEVIVWRSLRQAPPVLDLLVELLNAIAH